MSFGPIISSLRRHRIAATLIILEIALTSAIVSNAVFLISERLTNIERPSGVVESELLRIRSTGIRDDADGRSMTKRDLDLLRALPGVRSVAISNQLPFGNSSWNSDVRLSNDAQTARENSASYLGSEDLLETFGLELIAGRDFEALEYVDYEELRKKGSKVAVPAAILTRALAEKMFPGKPAVGEQIYSWGSEPIRVVGVVEQLRRPGTHRQAIAELSFLMPIRISYDSGGVYLLRVDSERRDAILKDAVATLESNDPNRIILASDTVASIRSEFFAGDRAMTWLLVAVCLALLLITALGIVGLASFWVQQRTREIGVRRALGANRSQILRYFQTENFILTSAGIVLGVALAYGINDALVEHYQVARLPLSYLPVGALFLYTLCQAAVLGPAMRAARVPPAVATRGAK